MKKVIGINDWVLNKKIRNDNRHVHVSIFLKYPDIKPLLNHKPQLRRKLITQDLNKKLKKLLATNLIEDFKLIGSRNKPSGIRTKLIYSDLTKIDKLQYIQTIFVKQITRAKKNQTRKKETHYYCVKMTIALEIENQIKGNQTIEERIVLIKAKSFENAYEKIDKQRKDYSEPYLNKYGELVKWKIESLDDCYVTDIGSIKDLDSPEGVEIYSKLKTRRFKTKD